MRHLALAANPSHQQRLCRQLGLGSVCGPLEAVAGGLHHRMWRLATDRGCYAVKQLAPGSDLSGGPGVNPFESTEHIAAQFARRGIPAVHALVSEGRYLQCIEGDGYLVYPWTDARAAGKSETTIQQLQAVARLLAAMHSAQVEAVAGLPAADTEYDIEHVDWLLQTALQRNVRHARLLLDLRPGMLVIAGRQRAARAQLARRQLVSHGDLDHKNVLWTAQGRPLVIDWESARPLNPSYETILEALDWAGITGQFRLDAFSEVLRAYTEAGGILCDEHADAAIDCIEGDWLYWLLYNVGRANDLEHRNERAVGNEQIDLALAVLMRLRRLRPMLLQRLRLEEAANRCST